MTTIRSGFLLTPIRMTLNDLESPILLTMRLADGKLAILRLFCALHDQLASLNRHAQLTRCFSAVAELLACQ